MLFDRHTAFGNCKTQSGVTLIEVMVAMFVFAVGVLGVAGLQITSLKLSRDSALRTQAEFLAYGLIDSARANAIASPYTISSSHSSPTSNCYKSVCLPAQLRAHDLYLWQEQVKQAFGEVKSATVKYDAALKRYTIELSWNDRYQVDESSVADAETKKFVYQFTITN